MADATTPDDDNPVSELSSLCMACHATGTTRLLLTRIPFFRSVLLSSFTCPSCHAHNTEVQPAGSVPEKGVLITFRPSCTRDLARQVVKGDRCVIRIPEVELEIPPGRGQLTNLDGLVRMVMADLEGGQDARREAQPDAAGKIDAVLERLRGFVEGSGLPCTIEMDDPSGGSSLEPDPAGDGAGKLVKREYARSAAQNRALGLAASSSREESHFVDDGRAAPPPTIRPQYSAASHLYPAPPPAEARGVSNRNADDGEDAGEEEEEEEEEDILENKVYSLPTPCPSCTRPTTVNAKTVHVPHFRQVIIMATHCGGCGYRSNEVKSGGAIPPLGRKITLAVRVRADGTAAKDLGRDILKGEDCRLACPELGLDVEPGTLGGRFTTVEGLLAQVRDDLKATVFDVDGTAGAGPQVATAGTAVAPHSVGGAGDSMARDDRRKWEGFFEGLDAAIRGERGFTVVLADPTAGSYVQSFAAPEPDEGLRVEDYRRSEREEEELGLRDMRVGGYEGGDGEERGAGVQGKAEGGGVDVDAVQAAVRRRMELLEEAEEPAQS